MAFGPAGIMLSPASRAEQGHGHFLRELDAGPYLPRQRGICPSGVAVVATRWQSAEKPWPLCGDRLSTTQLA
jgi:hypothetical protein